MKRRRGFNLVELMVALAIIALLLSLLFPAMSKVRERSKTVSGQTHGRGTVRGNCGARPNGSELAFRT